MFESVRTQVLRVFRVPHDPEPPAGAPGSVQVFRAGRNFYQLRLLRWALGQAGAAVGIWASLVFLGKMEQGVADLRQAAPPPAVTKSAAAEPGSAGPAEKKASGRTKASRDRPRQSPGIVRIAERWPGWVFPVLRFFEAMGIAIYLVQIPLTYAMVRLDYELRWYIVTDRSLRIRSGLATVQESTMSFANLQQVVVTQGPIQRLLGLADVRVQSAGGGGDTQEHKTGDSLHTGVFYGVDNADEIRDLILARLRQFRETGLGDPDERHAARRGAEMVVRHDDALAAARELLHEARALRTRVT